MHVSFTLKDLNKYPQHPAKGPWGAPHPPVVSSGDHSCSPVGPHMKERCDVQPFWEPRPAKQSTTITTLERLLVLSLL